MVLHYSTSVEFWSLFRKRTICIMTSYALSLTVVVVDPRRLALACRNSGGKQAGRPAGQKCYQDENKTSLTKEGVLVLCLI